MKYCHYEVRAAKLNILSPEKRKMNLSSDKPAVTELLDLSGRCALVTGASGNIGSGIAKRLAEAGAEVIVHYRSNAESAKVVVADIVASGGRAVSLQTDLTSEEDVSHLFSELADKELLPDCVVNNAAVQPVASLPDMILSDWQEVMAANLDSAFLVTQAAASNMRQHKVPGSIVNIASIEGLDPAGGHSHYTTTKSGLIMFTRSCALEYGADHIRVNAVSPGLIDREGLAADWPDGVGRWQDRAPLRRIGLPNDVADAVLFLLSPAARWISGANLVVDGGMSAQSKW
jgi:NAD(P)-dependent dehydrogenase (short-subunit alcohol dehydrogenase family)